MYCVRVCLLLPAYLPMYENAFPTTTFLFSLRSNPKPKIQCPRYSTYVQYRVQVPVCSAHHSYSRCARSSINTRKMITSMISYSSDFVTFFMLCFLVSACFDYCTLLKFLGRKEEGGSRSDEAIDYTVYGICVRHVQYRDTASSFTSFLTHFVIAHCLNS